MNVKQMLSRRTCKIAVATEPLQGTSDKIAALSRSPLHQNYVIRQFGKGTLGVERAAKLLRISGSQVRRLSKAFNNGDDRE